MKALHQAFRFASCYNHEFSGAIKGGKVVEFATMEVCP
jgi:hypothetical protein